MLAKLESVGPRGVDVGSEVSAKCSPQSKKASDPPWPMEVTINECESHSHPIDPGLKGSVRSGEEISDTSDIADHHGVTRTFDQLADRLRRLSVNESASTEEASQIMPMTLEELKMCPMNFAKAHAGKLFKDMVKETRYMTWFAETYRSSQKPAHMKFLMFIQCTWTKSNSR